MASIDFPDPCFIKRLSRLFPAPTFGKTMNQRHHQLVRSSTPKTKQMAWRVDGTHVYPIDDLREHSLMDCWCGPFDDDGITVHNSLDGREMYECGERKPS
jgi:hypothetical protein